MRASLIRFTSFAVVAGFVVAAVAAPPEKKSNPQASEAKAEAKSQAEKPIEKKPADDKPAAVKPPEKKLEPAKPVEKKEPEKKEPEKKPAAEAKPIATKPAVRQPTRVDPADNAKQPVFAGVAPPPAAKPMTPGGKYPAGDMKRPRPLVVSPATESSQQQPGRAPSDAIVLFDGTTLDAWKKDGNNKDPKASDAPLWITKNGYMECQPKSGQISTRETFGDCQLHLEWATPSVVKGNSQGRGNSGVMLQGIGEVQVLDSYENDTYPDGQAAAIYSKYPPLVNASRRPGEWQTYDIVIELAKIDPATKQMTRPARLTVFHNGVLCHHAVEVADSRASTFRLAFQDHGNPVRYRNVWLRPLKGYDAVDPQPVAMPKPEAKPAETKKQEAPAATKKNDPEKK